MRSRYCRWIRHLSIVQCSAVGLAVVRPYGVSANVNVGVNVNIYVDVNVSVNVNVNVNVNFNINFNVIKLRSSSSTDEAAVTLTHYYR